MQTQTEGTVQWLLEPGQPWVRFRRARNSRMMQDAVHAHLRLDDLQGLGLRTEARAVGLDHVPDAAHLETQPVI